MIAAVITAGSAVFGVLKGAALGAPVFLRPLLDPRIMILIAACLAGAKGCDTWHGYMGLRAERAALKRQIAQERELKDFARAQAKARQARIDKLEIQTHDANQALKPGMDGDCPCTYNPRFIELHRQIGGQ